MEQIEGVTWTDIVTAIAAVLAFGVLIFAALYARHQLHSMEKTREAQLLADLSRRWDEELLTESRQAVGKYKNGSELSQSLEELRNRSDEQYYVILRLPDFFEDLGLLVNKKCLSLQLAKDMFGTAVKYHYNLYKDTIENMRKIYKDQTIYKFFEDLAEEIKDN